jgi:hypothetical protein
MRFAQEEVVLASSKPFQGHEFETHYVPKARTRFMFFSTLSRAFSPANRQIHKSAIAFEIR